MNKIAKSHYVFMLSLPGCLPDVCYPVLDKKDFFDHLEVFLTDADYTWFDVDYKDAHNYNFYPDESDESDNVEDKEQYPLSETEILDWLRLEYRDELESGYISIQLCNGQYASLSLCNCQSPYEHSDQFLSESDFMEQNPEFYDDDL